MTERQRVNKFIRALKGLKNKNLWVYKIGDTFGGHKKPCDVVGCYKGQFFAIEFKKMGRDLSNNQIKNLTALKRSKAITISIIIDDIKSIGVTYWLTLHHPPIGPYCADTVEKLILNLISYLEKAVCDKVV